MVESRLTEADVERLVIIPPADVRAETAVKLAHELDANSLTETERQVVEDIFRMIVLDAELCVREVLSQSLKSSTNIPQDVVRLLAQDVSSVALPVIQYSEVLSDADLIEIINSQNARKQIAIAARSRVSSPVADLLLKTGNEDVVETLVVNQNADISEQALLGVVNDFQANTRIQCRMMYRKALPFTVMERLVTGLSEDLRRELLERHDLPPETAAELALLIRERVVLGLQDEREEQDVEDLVARLRQNDRLAPSIMLRALCMGDLPFFEAGMARLTHAPLHDARAVIHDDGPLGLRSICAEAGLPASYFPVIRAAIGLMGDIQYDGRPNDRARCSRLLMERILTMFNEGGIALEQHDIEYLLMKIGQVGQVLNKDKNDITKVP